MLHIQQQVLPYPVDFVSTTGQLIAVVQGNLITVFQYCEEKNIFSLKDRLRGHRQRVGVAVFSPGGGRDEKRRLVTQDVALSTFVWVPGAQQRYQPQVVLYDAFLDPSRQVCGVGKIVFPPTTKKLYIAVPFLRRYSIVVCRYEVEQSLWIGKEIRVECASGADSMTPFPSLLPLLAPHPVDSTVLPFAGRNSGLTFYSTFIKKIDGPKHHRKRFGEFYPYEILGREGLNLNETICDIQWSLDGLHLNLLYGEGDVAVLSLSRWSDSLPAEGEPFLSANDLSNETLLFSFKVIRRCGTSVPGYRFATPSMEGPVLVDGNGALYRVQDEAILMTEQKSVLWGEWDL